MNKGITVYWKINLVKLSKILQTLRRREVVTSLVCELLHEQWFILIFPVSLSLAYNRHLEYFELNLYWDHNYFWVFPRQGNVIQSFTWILNQQTTVTIFFTCTCLQVWFPHSTCSALIITINGTQSQKVEMFHEGNFFIQLYICQCELRVLYK